VLKLTARFGSLLGRRSQVLDVQLSSHFGHFSAKAHSSQVWWAKAHLYSITSVTSVLKLTAKKALGATWNADPSSWMSSSQATSVTSVLKLTALNSSKLYAKIRQKSWKIRQKQCQNRSWTLSGTLLDASWRSDSKEDQPYLVFDSILGPIVELKIDIFLIFSVHDASGSAAKTRWKFSCFTEPIFWAPNPFLSVFRSPSYA